MSFVKIGNKRLAPAPMISVNKTLSFTADGQPISSDFIVEFQGTLLPGVGSPSSTGWTTGDNPTGGEIFVTDNDKFEALLKKQDLLREAFNVAGVPISYKASGFDEVSFYGVLQGITFTPNPWVVRSDYTVQFKTPILNKVNSSGIEDQFLVRTSGLNLKSVSDTWGLSTSPESTGIYQVTRTTSATASAYVVSGVVMATGDSQSWLNARQWVLDRIAQSPTMTFSALFPSGYNASGYNLVREESIDTLGGTYTLSQRYSFAQTNYTEQQTISRTLAKDLLADGGPTVLNIDVNGTIVGYDVNNVPSGRLENARARYTAISGGIVAAVGANGAALVSNVTDNIYEGSLSYSFNFVNNLGSTYRHSYDVAYNQGDSKPSVTINGTVEGISVDGLPSTKFAAALAGYDAIDNSIKSNAFEYATGVLFGYNTFPDFFADIPSSTALSYNKAQGVINYSRTYLFGTGTSATYNEDYVLELNTQNTPSVDVVGAITTVSIQGTITGLAADGNPATKNANAMTAWSTIKPLLFPRCSGYYVALYTNPQPLSSGVVSKVVTNNRINGTLSYNVVFNNNQKGSGDAADALISVENTFSRDLMAVQLIPGRVDGPIIQSIGSKGERGQSINITLTMRSKTGGGYWEYSDITTPRNIASGYFATIVGSNVRGTDYYVTSKQETWNWRQGQYATSMALMWATGVVL